MLTSAEQVVQATAELDFAAFQASALHRAAVSMHLLALGEGVRNLSEGIKAREPDVPWRDMVGLRNRLAHAYARASTIILFKTAKERVPSLIPLLRRLLDSLGPEN